MAHLITSDDKFRDLAYDDGYRAYLITRRDAPSEYRFGRMQRNAFAPALAVP
jgi:hypothetical protein